MVDLSGLPEHATQLLRSVLIEQGRRYVVAYHPRHREALLRHKNEAGLAEWHDRDWKMFAGDAPLILDVTDEVPGLLRQLYRLTEADRCTIAICLRPPLLQSPPMQVFGSAVPALTPDVPHRPPTRNVLVVNEVPQTPGAPARLVVRKTGPATEADFAAGRLHDLTASCFSDVVPFCPPYPTSHRVLRDGDKQVTVQAVIGSTARRWGEMPAVHLVVRDGGDLIWQVAVPPPLLPQFLDALRDVAEEALQALQVAR